MRVGPIMLLGVVPHNGAGLLGGIWAGRLLCFEEGVGRTLALDVCMQNSGFAAAIGVKCLFFRAALPDAIFSVWHNLSGSLLSGYWVGRPLASEPDRPVPPAVAT